MDKYETLLNEIMEKTKSGEIYWKIEPANAYETVVFQSGFAANKYSSTFNKNERKYTLVFVEKHMPDQGGDWDGIAQKYYPELYFITNKGVAFILDKRYVEIDDLVKLADLIRESNEDAKSLFE